MSKNQDLVPTGPQEIAVVQPLDIKQILERTRVVAQVMEQVMEADVHYGIIPGCSKPSLYKAGAEKIAVTFQLAIDTEIEDLSHGDEVRYRVRAIAKSLNGQFLGSAYGECSSHEEKYRWRKAYKADWENAEDDEKRIKHYGSNKVLQIFTNPADIANTVLQMADKRAYVSVVRKVTAASDVFTQGVEDLEKELLQNEEIDGLQPTSTDETPPKDSAKKNAAKPKDKPAQNAKNDAPVSTNTIAPSAVKLVQAKLTQSNVSAEDFCKQFNIKAVPELTMNKINDAFAWIKENKGE